jgi:hypothetical protein
MSFAKVVEIAKIAASLIPVVVGAVKAIEEALPEKGQGAEKLAIVRQMIEAAFAAIQGVSVTFAEVWPTVERLVAALVALFNKTGAFRK